MDPHGPLLSELARAFDQVEKHLDTIDRQADLIAGLCHELASRATSMVVPTFSPAPTTPGNHGSATGPGPS